MRRCNAGQTKTIYKGSTPSLLFRTPYSASIISGGFITFSQRGAVVFEKTINGPGVQISDNLIKVELTQDETLKLITADVCKIQIRVILSSGERLVSNVIGAKVGEILKGGEI